jgi:hypothetical protein
VFYGVFHILSCETDKSKPKPKPKLGIRFGFGFGIHVRAQDKDGKQIPSDFHFSFVKRCSFVTRRSLLRRFYANSTHFPIPFPFLRPHSHSQQLNIVKVKEFPIFSNPRYVTDVTLIIHRLHKNATRHSIQQSYHLKFNLKITFNVHDNAV